MYKGHDCTTGRTDPGSTAFFHLMISGTKAPNAPSQKRTRPGSILAEQDPEKVIDVFGDTGW
jgi:hypothetical protein